jgi:spore germination cell wall hydrolase CwlJ-like protein
MGWLEAIFQAESFSSILNFATYFEGVATYSDRMLDEIIDTREFIESEEIRLQQENQELEILKINAEAEKSRVNELISNVSSSISQYADQIDDAEAEARAYEAEMKKLENDLKYLKKKLAEEQALSQLAANSEWRNISDVTFAEGDRYLLANLIYCEAGGEPYAGQLAVGSVVINRVLSSRFPNTVVGVIYQKRQFSPVGSGRLDLALAMNKATPSCYKAADEAMAGLSNVGNCVFFRTPIEGLTGISIGGHIFY